MILVATVILLHSAGLAGSMPGGPGVPENITVTFLNPTSVRVSWDTSIQHVEKYDVTYKPTDASFRVVAIVAGNSDAVTLSGLKPDTQYQLTVAAVWRGRKFRSRPIVFRTLEPPRTSPHTDVTGTFATEPPSSTTFSEPPSYVEYPQTSSTVRGVEIGIVLLVLVVWIAAIALFFNRWGKIRMLLPYQPDYKRDQLKVPGTAACAAAVASGNACSHASGEHVCTQLASAPLAATVANCVSATITTAVGAKVIHRPRLNSAIFTSTSGPGFDSKEFFRRHGSQSRLCRKARSVENMSTDNENDDDSMMVLESQRYNEYCHHHRHRAHAHQPCLQQQQANSAPQHFGLPMLSVSGPSPPEDNDTDSERGRFLK